MTDLSAPRWRSSPGGPGGPEAPSAGRQAFPLSVHNRTRSPEASLLAAGAAAAPRRQQLQPPPTGLPMPPDGPPRRPCCSVPRSRPALDCAQGPRDRLLDDRSGVSASLATLGRQGGGLVLDAPVTVARKGPKPTSLFGVGGAETNGDLERARSPAGRWSASRITPHSGPVAAGKQAKAVNQVWCSQATRRGEGGCQGQRLGRRWRRSVKASHGAAARPWKNRLSGKCLGSDRFPLGFKLGAARKDLAIALAAAAASPAPARPAPARPRPGAGVADRERVAAIEDALIEAATG